MQISKLLNIIRVATRSNAKCTDATESRKTLQPTNPASLRDGRETKVILRDLAPSPPLSLSSESLYNGKSRSSLSPMADSEPTSTAAALHSLARGSSRRRSSTKICRIIIEPSEEVTEAAANVSRRRPSAASARPGSTDSEEETSVGGKSRSEPASTALLHGLARGSSRRRSSTKISRTISGPSEQMPEAVARVSRRRSSTGIAVASAPGSTDSEEEPLPAGRSRRRVHFNPRVKVVATYSERVYDRSTVLVKGPTRTSANMFAVTQQMGRLKNNKMYPIRVALS